MNSAFGLVKDGDNYKVIEVKFDFAAGTSEAPQAISVLNDGDKSHAQERYKIIIANSEIFSNDEIG